MINANVDSSNCCIPVLTRYWLVTPGWSTSWIQLARMAASTWTQFHHRLLPFRNLLLLPFVFSSFDILFLLHLILSLPLLLFFFLILLLLRLLLIELLLLLFLLLLLSLPLLLLFFLLMLL